MSATLTLRVDSYRPGERQRPHSHDELHFSLLLSGFVSEEVGSATEYGGPLSVVVKDAGVVHANAFAPGGTTLARLSLAGGTMRTLLDDDTRAASWRWTHDAQIARPFLRLVRRVRERTSSVGGGDADLIDLLAAFTARRVENARGEPPRWLSHAMTSMREGWHPGMTVPDVAKAAGVHPVYLARCVRRWYGHGIADELRRLRLRAASAAIADGRATLSSIAHATGFSDQSHLCRAFWCSTGIAPGAYRALVRSVRHIGCADSSQDRARA